MNHENEGSQNGEVSKTRSIPFPLLWDSILPLEINLNRLKDEGMLDLLGRSPGSTVMDKDNDKTQMLSVVARTIADLNHTKLDRDKYLDQITKLEEK